MRHIIFFLLISIYTNGYCQSATEVYIAKIKHKEGKFNLIKVKNISENPGYDNQPSFVENNKLLYTGTYKGQTDVVFYNIKNEDKIWLSNSPQGSEYSPQKIPGKVLFSAVRLDTTGLQLLYQYRFMDGKYRPVSDSLKIGYYRWFSSKALVATVLVEDRMDLIIYDSKIDSAKHVYENVDRSIHHIPKSSLLSFIANKKEGCEIRSIHPETGQTKLIVSFPKQYQDILWYDEDTILIPKNKMIQTYKLSTKSFGVFYEFKDPKIKNITRMAISPLKNNFAFVVEE